jgi:hypothetical protein
VGLVRLVSMALRGTPVIRAVMAGPVDMAETVAWVPPALMVPLAMPVLPVYLAGRGASGHRANAVELAVSVRLVCKVVLGGSEHWGGMVAWAHTIGLVGRMCL